MPLRRYIDYKILTFNNLLEVEGSTRLGGGEQVDEEEAEAQPVDRTTTTAAAVPSANHLHNCLSLYVSFNHLNVMGFIIN